MKGNIDSLDQENLAILGKKIRETRERNNLSQIQLAKILGYKQPLISHWEKGKEIPNSLVIMRLVNEFGLVLNEDEAR